jgi:hypothetical protein
MCTFVAMLAALYCCTCVYFRSLFLYVRLLPCWRHCTAVRVYIFGASFYVYVCCHVGGSVLLYVCIFS